MPKIKSADTNATRHTCSINIKEKAHRLNFITFAKQQNKTNTYGNKQQYY